ncbi:MAG: hypothetical protein PHI79_07120 [Sulfurovaceae bacterium]|nr:hypothetical protein [Sulfurovaceae bacterium]MDD5549348.1 hypothetical protein [Sulfurovaceae bacterium]
MNYNVEIRQDVIGILHTFLVITDATGIEHGYGFAPEQTGLYGSGNS